MAASGSTQVPRDTLSLDEWGPRVAPTAWLFARLVLGLEFLRAGWEKLGDAGWTASPRGAAVEGFLNGALDKANTAGGRPEVQHWFAQLTDNVFLPNSELFAYLVTAGELLVGLALIIGLFTRLSALFGVTMNLAFLFAGTTSSNPQMLLLGLAIVLVGGSAVGWYGADRWVSPWLRTHAGERTVRVARDVAVGAGVAFAAWLALIATDTATWAVMLAIALGVAAIVWYSDQGVFHRPTGGLHLKPHR